MQLFNATTQQDEDVTWSADHNHEIIATFANGHFYKFPAGSTIEEVQAHATAIKESSQGQEIITPEMEAAAAEEAKVSQDLVDQLNAGNTMPQGDQTNAPTTEPAQRPSADPAPIAR